MNSSQMNPKSNEVDYSSFETGMNNLSLGQPPRQQQQYFNQQQTPGNGEWTQDENDEQPLSFNNRPVSIRNVATSNNRPSNFIKPAAPQSNKSIIPQDMHLIQDLYETYSQKVYFEGYLYKKNDLTVDGKPFIGDNMWSRQYVELCGPVLTLWDIIDNNEDQENIMPHYINITDSIVEFIGHYTQDKRENVFSLNSAGANRYLFDVNNYNALLQWISAIRLSCFECSKLQEIYTRNFITRSIYSDILLKPSGKMEGFVQVRFTGGTTEWQKYWTVVSDKKEEKKLFSKKSIQSRGQMMFYESKKSKTPILTLVNVVQSYIIYPESPQLIDLATMLKVEGNSIKSNGEQTTCTALIMASSPKELVQWLIGTFDTFKLYGRPAKLIEDSSNINSLNFGEPINGSNLPRLFLEVPEVNQVNVKDENLIDNKAKFAGILLSKIQQRQQQQGYPRQSMGLIHQIPGGMNSNQIPGGMNSMNQYPGGMNQRGSVYQQQQQLKVNQPPGRVIYASDEESEEDDEDEEDEESDNDSIFKPETNITRESLSLPALSTEDDGFANSILDGIEKKKEPLDSPIPTSSNTSLPLTKDKGKQPANDNDFSVSDTEDEQEESRPAPSINNRRPKQKMATTQVSLSGSDEDEDSEEEEDDDEEEGSYSGSDDDDIPIQGRNQQQFQHDQQLAQGYYNQFDEFGNPQQAWNPQQGNMYQDDQGYYDEDGYPLVDENGPIIPQLGDRFATQNSLLDSYRPDHPSARDQEGFARATGQPLIQVPNKPPEPRAGLVGMISQIEQEKKLKESSKNRFGDLEKERMMERERERYILEQRSQMMPMGMNMMNQPMMDPRMMMNMQMMGGQMPMMGMMDPRMSMMYNPAMMQQNPSMMNMPMMNPMMDPRMSMMMMQQQYGQYPMWQQQQQQQPMYGNNRFNNNIQEDDDEDDDVPLGAKDSPIPRHNN